MLILHQSNRLENLAQSFASLLQNLPINGVFTPETIVIQSQGMKRYVNRFLALHNGIAANLDFNLPARFMWKTMQQSLGQLPKVSPFSSTVLHWRLMQLFENPQFKQQNSPAAQYLSNYIDSRDEAYFDLAFILADIFDQYMVYRFDWTEAWQHNQLLGLGADEAWQADLWQQLTAQESHQGEHRLQVWERFLEALPTAKLPERIWVFGITSMAPMYLDLFRQLSQYTDVHIFATNPSQAYWGDVIEPTFLLRKYESMSTEEAAQHQGHPLLASLGKQGRDFFSALTSDIEYEFSLDLFQENANTTLLARLQNDLLHLHSPQNHATDPTHSGLNHPDLYDGSIVMNSAHSALRELQILKDHIIQNLAQNPTWQLHDIAVLTPQVDPYLPYLEAVFGPNCPDGKPLAYSVSDVRLSRQQPLMQAIEQFLHLMDSRFELSDMLPLLDTPALQQRFDWDTDDVALLHTTIRELNIRWGLDDNMRRQFGGEGDAFTWSQALERVCMGWMLPQGSSHIAWHELVPYDSEPNHWAILAQLNHLVSLLQSYHQQWQEDTDIATWVIRLQDAIKELFLPLERDAFSLQQWQQNLQEWQQYADMAQYQGKLSFAIVKRHISAFLQQQSQAGFLRGGITICSMVPMRGLPFQMLCLLGMNDGEFPRDTKAPSFDLIYQDALHHRMRKGDRSRRDDDRYLFLETLLNARSQLYLSYIGKSIKNDERLAASTVVYEFIDTIALMVGASSQDLIEGDGEQAPWITSHPLQAFSPNYFAPQAKVYSYRQDIAQALNAPAKHIEAFIDGAYENHLQALPTQHEDLNLHMHEWLAFWRNPTRVWLKQQLSWQDTYAQDAWPEQELFELDAYDSMPLYEAFYDARRQRQSLEHVAAQILQRNQVPMGKLSQLHIETIQKQVLSMPSEWFHAPTLPNLDHVLEHRFHDGSHVQLQLSLSHRTDCGQIFWFHKTPTAPEKMAAWLEHLAFCAIDHSHIPKTTIIAWAENAWQWRPVNSDVAKQYLLESLILLRLGKHKPLPFFARASLAAGEAWYKQAKKTPDDEAIIQEESRKKAYVAFAGNHFKSGQLQQEEGTNLVYAHSEDSPLDSHLFMEVVKQMCVPMYEYIVAIEDADKETHAS
ncbi:exodeoxyribonuclease V subunit gamma [Vitreoscilla stercoraria]|uniref:RecBCD enzyme subunit RecC n=1 Tax=Vitreoscilla stercoraria TaxID=61 RepID=A0ABY4E8F1_VITST|nr:exodeoxyribonuclease V subunit gamma [Vitreoscilla stercoraria]UOO91685.1 exodeoxyribonuclease V subunit gamma [Vitreoscilla stercoraria]